MGWDDITIPLGLRGVRVIAVLENTPTRLKAEVRSGWSVSRHPRAGTSAAECMTPAPDRCGIWS